MPRTTHCMIYLIVAPISSEKLQIISEFFTGQRIIRKVVRLSKNCSIQTGRHCGIKVQTAIVLYGSQGESKYPVMEPRYDVTTFNLWRVISPCTPPAKHRKHFHISPSRERRACLIEYSARIISPRAPNELPAAANCAISLNLGGTVRLPRPSRSAK